MSLGLTREQKKMVVILLLGALLAVLNLTLLAPAFPSIMIEYDIDATTAQWLTSVYSLVEAIIIPLSAFFLGRFSTRELFLYCFSIFTVGSLLSAWGPNFWILLLGRILQASGTGIVMPMTFTLILLVFPIEKRGMAMGFVTLIMGFAPAVGPVIAGLLIDSLGWHVLFLLVTICSIGMFILGATSLKSYGSFERITFDKLSVVLSSTALFCLLYGLSSFSSTDNYWLVSTAIALGVVLAILFVRRQFHLEVPMLKIDVFRSHRFTIGCVVVTLANSTLIAIGVILPLFIQTVRGYPATTSGLVTLPGAILGAIMAPIAGNIFDKHGARTICTIGAALLVCGASLLCMLDLERNILLAMIGYAAICFGIQCIINPASTWGINSLDNSVIQHANALTNTFGQIGTSFMTALLVSCSALSVHFAPDASPIVQACLGDRIAFAVALLLFVLTLALTLIFIHDKEKSQGRNQQKRQEQTKATAS